LESTTHHLTALAHDRLETGPTFTASPFESAIPSRTVSPAASEMSKAVRKSARTHPNVNLWRTRHSRWACGYTQRAYFENPRSSAPSAVPCLHLRYL